MAVISVSTWPLSRRRTGSVPRGCTLVRLARRLFTRFVMSTFTVWRERPWRSRMNRRTTSGLGARAS